MTVAGTPTPEPPSVPPSLPPPAPPRPAAREERWATRLFLALSPRLPRVEIPAPPPRMEPWSTVWIERPGRRGRLQGTWYPAHGRPSNGGPHREPRGAVLLLPPWLEWGRSYFHRRRRVESLREAGYHALTFDFPGFAGSGPVDGLLDRDAADALGHLALRAPDLPLFVWGVSAGGYWSHQALSRPPAVSPAAGRVRAAFYEDVSPHLLEWASRTSPWARPFHRLFHLLFPRAFRYLDARLHAPALRGRPVVYLSGGEDPGVRPDDTRTLAAQAGGAAEVVAEADHLQAIKVATQRVIERALATFQQAP
jgi:hypothetical protein